jgi:WD40 repeat protein
VHLHGELSLWDIPSSSVKKTLIAHTYNGMGMPVSCFAVDGDNLFSASLDGTIKAWNLEGNFKYELGGHQNAVFSIAIHGNFLYSASADCTLKIWDIKKRECFDAITHPIPVRAVTIGEGILCSAACGRGDLPPRQDVMYSKLQAWNPTTGAHLHDFVGHRDAVSSLQIVGGRLYSASHDGTARIWNLHTGACLRILPHAGPVLFLGIAGEFLCTACDRSILIWDRETGQGLHVHTVVNADLTSLLVKDGIITYGCANGTIHTLNFTMTQEAVFAKIAALFRTPTRDNVVIAMERFKRMPKEARMGVYSALFNIMSERKSTFIGSRRDAFHDENGLYTAPDLKAQAIDRYLTTLQTTAG